MSRALRILAIRVPRLDRDSLRARLLPLAHRLEERATLEEARDAVDAAIALCRILYSGARSGEALLLARATLSHANVAGDAVLRRRAAMLCGLIAADAGDIAGAIEHHVVALRLTASEGNADAMSRTWNNIGLAMAIAGQYELASSCYRRALVLVEHLPAPVLIRYAALLNLAHCLLQTREFEAGLAFAEQALREETPELREQDLHGALLLRRNLVRLLVAEGRLAEAEPHVAECAALAERTHSPRSQIAAAITRAIHEMARGRTDLALTRLEGSLARARKVPAALRDTLTCVIHAEEAAGNIGRALLRMSELSEHIYRSAVDRAREHVELAGLSSQTRSRVEHDQEQTQARLSAKVGPPHPPPEWETLERLAVSAALRMEPSGWHGKRVGALVKALAIDQGSNPLQALEMGLAAEVHDIGMLSVPEAILKKSEPLNEAERIIVRRHVDAGAEILRDDRHPRTFMAREMATYHHARWDGEGYPGQIEGKAIPLAARVCAVADTYDAMVCGIGGRAPRPMDEALGELRREAGRQLDPDLVRRFDAMIRARTEDLGLDRTDNAGMEGFQELIRSLREDRGFV